MKRGQAVPETVADQVRLWESERNRVTYQKGCLYLSILGLVIVCVRGRVCSSFYLMRRVRYDTFPSAQDYNQVVKYAKDMSVYLWSNDAKRLIMVTESGQDVMKVFIKKKIENK